MLKWFSISGISKEAKRVRWPKVADLTYSTVEALIFMGFFMVCFVIFEFIVTLFLRLIGIGA
ncbi:MAG: preprotein translocase subunit SecE [Erysipelotrichaceae bacterium]|nr:preprotein translocase subunit SecE [Erysipelotrichaceae bacterium]MDY5252984.1 preprotein translocase subunit SecE [Erysipelotrichaceae bacterium]